jgi:hypothetical protein
MITRFDPSGFIMEHYVDGDLLDMKEPTHHTKAAPDNLHVWGMLFQFVPDKKRPSANGVVGRARGAGDVLAMIGAGKGVHHSGPGLKGECQAAFVPAVLSLITLNDVTSRYGAGVGPCWEMAYATWNGGAFTAI